MKKENSKQKHIKEIEDSIRKYAQELPIDSFTRNPSKGDIKIAMDVKNILHSVCKDWVNEIIDDSEISEWAGKLMYAKYSPHTLRAILNEDVFYFLMLLDDYSFYKTGEKENSYD